jgi:hypothetical protein
LWAALTLNSGEELDCVLPNDLLYIGDSLRFGAMAVEVRAAVRVPRTVRIILTKDMAKLEILGTVGNKL